MQKVVRWFAFLSALVVLTGLLVLPIYSYQTATMTTHGVETRSSGSATFIQGNDRDGLFALTIPILAALSAVLPWPTRFRRTADVLSALIVTVFCILGALSVGIFFVPTALALAVVAVWPRPSTDG